MVKSDLDCQSKGCKSKGCKSKGKFFKGCKSKGWHVSRHDAPEG